MSESFSVRPWRLCPLVADGVLYQIYVRSFADSDGDGVGDLRGVIDRLDYLSWLGVDGIWLSPITPSPNADLGYDVADYCSVQPEYGGLADLDELIASANGRGIQVLIDLVPNHTSDRHAWFVDSRSSKDAEHRPFYVWVDPKPDGSPPEQLGRVFRRTGVDAGRDHRSVLPPQLPPRATGSELVVRRCPIGV